MTRKCTADLHSITYIHTFIPGKAKEKVGEFGEKEGAALVQKPFIFLHVNLLREYLGFELQVPSLPFAFDLERAIDDWVFMYVEMRWHKRVIDSTFELNILPLSFFPQVLFRWK